MNAMDDVSILFADIVGFTKMSSNKVRVSQLFVMFSTYLGLNIRGFQQNKHGKFKILSFAQTASQLVGLLNDLFGRFDR
jgi:hypothetical protein